MDSYRYMGLRKQLVDLLSSKGIKDEKVLAAIGKVPRHAFIDTQFDQYAYQDMAFKIGAGQTISQPFTVAFQTELLNASRGMKVLEIGTGSGYQTSVLMELGLKVFSIERQRILYDRVKILLPQLGYSPKLFFGDGFAGKSAFAPFDRILVTCGAPFVPEALLEQLKVGGALVIPVGEGEVQEMLRIERGQDGNTRTESFGEFKFVPMLPDRSNDI